MGKFMIGVDVMGIIEGAAVALLSAIGGWFGGFFGAYLKKKGENLATHEDMNKLIEQMTATTEATKAIEARIDDQVWNKQRQWELKRDAVIAVMQALSVLENALMEYSSLYKVWLLDPQDTHARAIKDKVMLAWKEKNKEFEYAYATASLLCSEEFNANLRIARSAIHDGALMLLEEKLQSDDSIGPSIRPAVQAVITSARRELGVSVDFIDQSSVPR